MKTVEPIFMLSCGDLYPVLTKYKVVRLFRGELREVELALVQFDRKITNMKLDAITVYNLDKIRNSNFNKEMDRIKFVQELDDDYYPNQAIVRDAVKESIDNIIAEQCLLVEDLKTLKCLLKWPIHDKILDYITSKPEDLIEVVKKWK